LSKGLSLKNQMINQIKGTGANKGKMEQKSEANLLDQVGHLCVWDHFISVDVWFTAVL
jgi:hypothetical protein